MSFCTTPDLAGPVAATQLLRSLVHGGEAPCLPGCRPRAHAHSMRARHDAEHCSALGWKLERSERMHSTRHGRHLGLSEPLPSGPMMAGAPRLALDTRCVSHRPQSKAGGTCEANDASSQSLLYPVLWKAHMHLTPCEAIITGTCSLLWPVLWSTRMQSPHAASQGIRAHVRVRTHDESEMAALSKGRTTQGVQIVLTHAFSSGLRGQSARAVTPHRSADRFRLTACGTRLDALCGWTLRVWGARLDVAHRGHGAAALALGAVAGG